MQTGGRSPKKSKLFMRLAQAVESCGLAQNLEVFKAETDFVSDCRIEGNIQYNAIILYPLVR